MRNQLQHQPEPGCAGFTLIEVLIVIAIFSVGILGAMTMQTTAVSTNATTRKSTLAIQYAEETMELLMRLPGSPNDKFNVDDNGVDGIDELAESEFNNDGIDNDADGTIDEADELEWHRFTEFQEGTGYVRGGIIPADAYYASIFNLVWDIADIDCDGIDGVDDAKRINITVSWNNGRNFIQLTGIRTDLL